MGAPFQLPTPLRPTSLTASATSSVNPSRNAPTRHSSRSTNLGERYSLKYTFDVYNLSNTSSFDVPGNEVSQNENYNSFPQYGQPLYNAPFGLGIVSHTIGSPRQIQMSLRLTF